MNLIELLPDAQGHAPKPNIGRFVCNEVIVGSAATYQLCGLKCRTQHGLVVWDAIVENATAGGMTFDVRTGVGFDSGAFNNDGNLGCRRRDVGLAQNGIWTPASALGFVNNPAALSGNAVGNLSLLAKDSRRIPIRQLLEQDEELVINPTVQNTTIQVTIFGIEFYDQAGRDLILSQLA